MHSSRTTDTISAARLSGCEAYYSQTIPSAGV